ncbi:MAG TPA: hypothetical protein VHL31_13775 [Geminicoccus sp.]|jgi:hypothetical protein|uniref:hypothetical protein n=1 Tax=Geminicoccus sp. TaxID=2024832 RepID=UPI002E32850D|nr:hypothetical protein [Geminicoccus sp.]HEX2527352.1 hypothetical protein [Geminicoccus sp.]
MPVLLVLIFIVLIAQIGFWDTLGAVLGGVAMIVLLIVLAGALLLLGGRYFLTRRRRG